VNPPEANLVGVEAVESQVAEDEGFRFRPSKVTRTLLNHPQESAGKRYLAGAHRVYRSKYGSLSMPKGPTPRPSAARNQHPPDRGDIIERLTGPCAEGEAV
jgi:hypothetical protein